MATATRLRPGKPVVAFYRAHSRSKSLGSRVAAGESTGAERHGGGGEGEKKRREKLIKRRRRGTHCDCLKRKASKTGEQMEEREEEKRRED
ncbi:hypothetical protein EYF80_020461 [Liparis tanakae]|uniref:Uncharacterized protein n=1 Tax=Liparis tanakae TaxID=230148 RepID=A0A4Z2HUJ5_9TELE|nr:hypothetical protein EYF80_020461 [Liparis tanakae]